jgi:hypothetical protein
MMSSRTAFITNVCWEDVWTMWYMLVDDAYQALEQHYGATRRTGTAPHFSDREVIIVTLIINT